MIQTVGKGEDLLIVSFSYSPMANPRAYRWTALAEEFARRGVRVQVVCSWQPGMVANETVNGVEIHRVGNWFVERCRSLLAYFRERRLYEMGTSVPEGPNSPIAKSIGSVFRQLAWPDTTCVWYPAALRKVNALLSALPNATLVGVTPSFTAALIVAAAARKRGNRWILDMGDPFSFATESPANNFFLYGWLNRRVERSLLQGASAVSLTNSSLQRKYAELYPESAKTLCVVPPLLSLAALDSNKREAVVFPSDGVIRLVYVGSLYKSLRRPDFLLALFLALTKATESKCLELHFFGRTDECNDAFARYRSEIGRTIKLHGQVTRGKAFAVMEQATLVVNLGNTNPCQLPSKLVEYMALGKPILNIIQTDADPSQYMLKEYRSALTILASEMLPTIEQIQATWRFIDQTVRCADGGCHGSQLERFGLTAIADQYNALLFRG